MRQRILTLTFSILLATGVHVALAGEGANKNGPAAGSPAVLTGQDSLGDWTTDAPGIRRRITVNDLPKPYETPSANNFPRPAR